MKGDLATLELNGERKDHGSATEDSRMSVTVTMKRENGKWCFDRQKPGVGDKPSPAAAGKAKPGQ